MPSTEPRLSLRLSYRRAETAGFWIAGLVLWSLMLVALSAALGATAPWAWAAAGTGVLLLPRAAWREWFQAGIWAWNRAVRAVAPLLRRYVLAVCYYTLFPVVGLSGSSLGLTSGGAASGWTPIPNSSLHGCAGRQAAADAQAHQGLVDAARRAHAPWVVILVPLLFLLRVLGEGTEHTTPSGSTYTLY